jgi:RHS repeat-associated protein
MTAMLAPLGYDTYLTYTPDGKIKTLTDASNATTTWDYDSVSFKVSSVTNPEGQSENFVYDLNDRLKQKINKDQTSINFTYDLKGRLKVRSSSSQSNSYSYDKDDNLIFASNSNAAVTLGYDDYERLSYTESSHVPGQLILTYDQRGLRKTLNYQINSVPVLTVNYSYDERKLLSEMVATMGGRNVTWQRFWDELGRPDQDLLSNGLKVQRGYDPAGRMTLLSNEYGSGNPLSRFELSYNASGTIKEILKTFIRPDQDTVGRYVLKYSYDDLDRLTYASTDGNFSYDIMGNHTNSGQVHNRLNQLLEDADYNYTYTTNGQLLNKVSKSTGEKTEYTWNTDGKIVQTKVKRGDGSIKSVVLNSYDAFNRRIARESSGQLTRYVYDGEDIILEFGINNTIQAIYLHGPGIDEPIAMARDLNDNGSMEANELFFFSKDHLNSVHDLTDSQGKPVQRYNYTAYGRTIVERMSTTPLANFVPNPFAYTSREWEQETGDYYYRARNYDPYSGRFLSEDPIGFKGGDHNLTNYVSNNPITYRDPFGLVTETCWAKEGIWPHNYICVNGICDGHGPDEPGGIFDTVPGGHQGGPSSDESGSFCKKIPTNNDDHEKCIDSCTLKTLSKARPPYTAFPIPGTGTYNCSSYVAETISNCLKECASKAISSDK